MKLKSIHRQGFMATLLPALLIGVPAATIPETGWSQAIEEIVVTTRRREENLQEIPVAVSAFGSDFIEKQGVVSTEDVVKLVPGVQFDQSFSSNDTRISIRGINNSRGRASVATLVDGIDISGESVTVGGGSSLLNINLYDLERIEVIKGPQSALYGRNAFAGAVSYITKKPNTEEFEGTARVDVGQYNTANAKFSVSAPVTDWFAFRFNAASFNNGGYYNNPNTGEELNGARTNGARLATLFTISDTFSIDASLGYSKSERDPRAVVKAGDANTFYDADGNVLPDTDPCFSAFCDQEYGQWLGTVGTLKEEDINLSASNRTGGAFAGSSDKMWLADLKLNWDVAGMLFTSKTSYLSNESTVNEDVDYQDGDGTPLVFGNTYYFGLSNDFLSDTDTKQFTQDFTLQDTAWDRGQWLVGVQGFWEDVDNSDGSYNWYNDENLADFLPCTDPDNPQPFDFACSYDGSVALGDPFKDTKRETTSYSIYGLLGFDFTEKFTGSIEARYVRDDIKVTTNTLVTRVDQTVAGVPSDLFQPDLVPTSDKVTTKSFNPRIALDYSFTDNAMVFWSAAKSTKPGGFGTAQFAVPQVSKVDPEKLYATELGTKTEWLDNTLRVNASIYYNKYKDRQVSIREISPFTGLPEASVTNAGEAETKGVELELYWQPVDIATFGLGYAWTDAEYTDFNFTDIRDGDVKVSDKAQCGNEEGDCKGAPVGGIPENALTLLASIQAPLAGDLEWFWNTNAQWQDKRALNDRVNTPYVDAFWNVDMQLGIQNDRWNLMLYSTNLFDNDKAGWGQYSQDFRDGMYGGNNGGEPRDDFVAGFLPNPRIVGVRLGVTF